MTNETLEKLKNLDHSEHPKEWLCNTNQGCEVVQEWLLWPPYEWWVISQGPKIDFDETQSFSFEGVQIHAPDVFFGGIKMQMGDKFQPYASPKETWDHLAGRSGWALIRDGKVCAYTVGHLS